MMSSETQDPSSLEREEENTKMEDVALDSGAENGDASKSEEKGSHTKDKKKKKGKKKKKKTEEAEQESEDLWRSRVPVPCGTLRNPLV